MPVTSAMVKRWNTFKAIRNGTRIYNHGYDQCVAVANRYHEGVLGGAFVPVDSAYQWWSMFNLFPELYNHYRKSNRPVPGAIVIWSGAGWNAQHGHIGVVLAVNGSTFTTLEQNVYGARYATRHTRSIYDGGLDGFLIPSSNPATYRAPAKPKELPAMAADMFVRRDKQAAVYAIDLTTGSGRPKWRRVSSLEWTVYQRARKRAGLGIPVTEEGPAAMKALIGKEK